MRRAYLFIYDNKVGTRDEVKAVFDTMSKVITWRFDIPHSFYIVSNNSAQELYDEFTSINSTKGRFIFIEAGSDRQGQMLPDTWYFLRHKKHKPKE